VDAVRLGDAPARLARATRRDLELPIGASRDRADLVAAPIDRLASEQRTALAAALDALEALADD
jgi:hypothetical protein